MQEEVEDGADDATEGATPEDESAAEDTSDDIGGVAVEDGHMD